MPLPQGGKVKWIPDAWRDQYRKYCEHDAWYAGDPTKLSTVHQSMIWTPTPRGRFWATDTKEERRVMLHVPIAGDIAQTSANLLFSEAPKVTVTSDATQKRLEDIMSEGGVFNRLIEAAETGAAMGGVFFKLNWDTEIAGVPILGVAQADTAIPEFQWGFLRACTFWRELDGSDHMHVVWRHLERHEMINGKAHILNGLYKGNKDELGIMVGLQAHPQTQDLLDDIDTGLPSLCVRYVPNMRPNRQQRGSSIGQSDYQGVEGLMDALDEVYTSWIRDIRMGRGRLIVPEAWLERQKDGSYGFDIDQELFTTLDMDPLSAEKAGLTISQFAIRTEEHYATAQELIQRIVSNAGYSPQTFGLSVDGRAESGTALNIRERKSFLTKGKKERYFRPAIEDMLELMLMIDKEVFRSGITPERPTIEFADSIVQDIGETARAVELISRAQAASIKTRVMMIHPDWTGAQIDEEVQLITGEAGILTTDTDDLPV